jgi:hypothetical protein
LDKDKLAILFRYGVEEILRRWKKSGADYPHYSLFPESAQFIDSLVEEKD